MSLFDIYEHMSGLSDDEIANISKALPDTAKLIQYIQKYPTVLNEGKTLLLAVEAEWVAAAPGVLKLIQSVQGE